jgi:hypothetical protein
MRGTRLHRRGQPVRVALRGKGVVEFGDIRDAHNGRREVATRGSFADELIKQPARTRKVRCGARRHDRSGHQMGAWMKADEVDPMKLWHRTFPAPSYSFPAN